MQNVPAAPKAKGERGELNIKMSTVVSFAAYQSLLEKKKMWKTTVAEAQQLNYGISFILLHIMK